MPRHPGQGSMTKGRLPGKNEGGGERVRERGKGRAVDRWRGKGDIWRDSITLRRDKYKVKEEQRETGRQRLFIFQRHQTDRTTQHLMMLWLRGKIHSVIFYKYIPN